MLFSTTIGNSGHKKQIFILFSLPKSHEGGVTGLATLATRPGLGKLMQKNRSRAPRKRSRSDVHNGAYADEDEEDDFEADICGGVVVSTGRDFSCRVWCESEELLVLEEEAELAREAAEDEHELARSEAVVPGAIAPEAGETGPLGRPTVTTRNAVSLTFIYIGTFINCLSPE